MKNTATEKQTRAAEEIAGTRLPFVSASDKDAAAAREYWIRRDPAYAATLGWTTHAVGCVCASCSCGYEADRVDPRG
jgi:hypothetical protein